MRILIIGGTGFIGACVCAQLARHGHEVTVLHRGAHEPSLPPSVRHVRDPLAAVPVLAFPKVILEETYDSVVHMTLIGEHDAAAAMRALRGRRRDSS